MYEARNGVVHRKINDTLLFYVQKAMEKSSMNKQHEELGHIGVEKIY